MHGAASLTNLSGRTLQLFCSARGSLIVSESLLRPSPEAFAALRLRPLPAKERGEVAELQQPRNPKPVDLRQHGLDILVAAAEIAARIGQRDSVDAVEPVMLVVHQAVAADQRPQHQAQHALV